jgi:hypothetical protein
MNAKKGRLFFPVSMLKILLLLGYPLFLFSCITYYHTVTIDHPEHERLRMEKYHSILIAGFAAEKPAKELKLEPGAESARYFRQAIKGHSSLKLIEQEPLELTPEKVSELASDPDYMKKLSLRAGADLIVLGSIGYHSKPLTEFEEAVYRHPQTKKLVKGTRVVNKVRHSLELALFIIEGSTGKPVYQDTLEEKITYRAPSPPETEVYFHLLNRSIARLLEIITPHSSKALRDIIA